MAKYHSLQGFGVALCEALRLNPDEVFSLTLELGVNKPATCRVEMYPDASEHATRVFELSEWTAQPEGAVAQ